MPIIKNEIKKIENEIKDLHEKSNMTKDEMESYKELTSKKVGLENKQEVIKEDLNNLNSIKIEEIFLMPNIVNLSEELRKKVKEELENLRKEYLNKFNEKLNKYIENIEKEKENIAGIIRKLK